MVRHTVNVTEMGTGALAEAVAHPLPLCLASLCAPSCSHLLRVLSSR